MRKFFRGTSLYLLLLIVIIFIVTLISQDVEQVSEIDVTELIRRLKNDEVEVIVESGNTLYGTFRDGSEFSVVLPRHMQNTFFQDYLKEKVDNEDFKAGFFFYPVNSSDLEKIADLGLKMPPKSTYIEPKPLSGLTIFDLKE